MYCNENFIYFYGVMNMKILLKKGLQKPSVLTIYRKDGSSTWSKLHRGLETHDLAHYAVESTLGFTNAFYGIINQGYTIQDFEAPKAIRPEAVKPENLYPEALITEHLVNLLEVELLNSGMNLMLLEDLKAILQQNNLPFPEHLNSDILEAIRSKYHTLYNQWWVLEDNEEIVIAFNF
jgi:hypothetical protein